MSLQNSLRDALRPILKKYLRTPEKLDDYLAMIKVAQNPEHGDYQANFAMGLAKELGEKPVQIAQRIIKDLSNFPWLDTATVAGPGFINFRHPPHGVLPFRDDKLQRPDFYSNFLHSRSTHPQSPLG